MKRQITPARREILTLLRRTGPQTVDQLSRQLGITPVGVRKHLDALEIDGLIQSTTERRRVGRPVQVYSLTDAADDFFPKAYDTALAAILRQIHRVGGSALLRQVLDGRHEEVETAFREQSSGEESLEEQVAILTRLRDEAGYMADWTREGDRFFLREHNCLLCRVARQFPQVCESEMALFRRLFGDHARVERLGHVAGGDDVCTYVIQARAA
jgi:predicted ArsR family transcriptional regulator